MAIPLLAQVPSFVRDDRLRKSSNVVPTDGTGICQRIFRISILAK